MLGKVRAHRRKLRERPAGLRVGGRCRQRTLINGCLFGNGVRGNFGRHLAMIHHAQLAIVGDEADLDGIEPPFVKNIEDFAFPTPVCDQQHPLL